MFCHGGNLWLRSGGKRRVAGMLHTRHVWRSYGEWVPSEEKSDGQLSVFGAYADEYDKYRPFYPAPFWEKIEEVCKLSMPRKQADLRPWTPDGATYDTATTNYSLELGGLPTRCTCCGQDISDPELCRSAVVHIEHL